MNVINHMQMEKFCLVFKGFIVINRVHENQTSNQISLPFTGKYEFLKLFLIQLSSVIHS